MLIEPSDGRETVQTVIDYFEIPDELARELSDLLTKHTIRERLLLQLVTDNFEKYEEVERTMMPITSRIEAIKVKITREFVPEKYKSSRRYIWNYTGYEVDGNKVEVIDNQ